MRLLVLGAFGAYPERVTAFIGAGHQIRYVCTEPWCRAEQLPAGTVFLFRDLGAGFEETVECLARLIESERVDAVYSLLNVWDGSNQATAALLRRRCPVPVIRHYKEHYLTPFEDERTCIERSAGVIFINPESHDYFAGQYELPEHTACLDADLIPRRYLAGTLQPKLSSVDGRPHVLLAGSVADDGGRYDYRDVVRELTGREAHVHIYGLFRRLQADGQLHDAPAVEASYHSVATPEYLHVHAPIAPARFAEEWSRYDAGLLHAPRQDDAFRVLNMPNRYSAYLAAGVPVAIPAGQMPAMQRHLEALQAAVVYETPADLVGRLPDTAAAARALAARGAVTFEAILPSLIDFIRRCLG